MDKNNPGDKCSKCKTGRIALMSTCISTMGKDAEPYESGKIEGNMEVCDVFVGVIGVHACEECGEIYKKWFDN